MNVIIGYDIGSYTFDASAKTITFSAIENISLNQIALITNVADGIIIYNFASATKGGSIISNVLTLDYDTTAMSDSDELQIIVSYNNDQDYNLGSSKNIVQNPTPSYYQDVVTLISAAQNVTTSFVDLGFEIPCAGYKYLNVFLTLDINNSLDFRIKALAKHTSAGAEEYPIQYEMRNSTEAIDGAYREINLDADDLYVAKINVESIPLIQIQISAGTVGVTAGQIDACYYTLSY